MRSKGNSTPSKEEIFEILANERRRHALAYLKQTEDDEVELRTLVTEVAARENDVPVKQVTSDERKSVYVCLRQTHLPKMERYGLITYDSNRGEIGLTDSADRTQFYLEYVPEDDIPWAYHYAGLSLLFASITVLAWQGLFPFAGLGGMMISGLIVGVFSLSALVHTVYTHRNKLGHSSRFGEA